MTSRTDLEADVRRVAERLRSAPAKRVADARDRTHDLLDLLARAAQGVEGRDDEQAPPLRDVPRLEDSALGDQVAVLGTDLVGALADLPDSTSVWTGTGRAPLADVVDEVASALRDLRLYL